MHRKCKYIKGIKGILVFLHVTHPKSQPINHRQDPNNSTEDHAKLNFPFLFKKSVVSMPRPHQKYQLFDFKQLYTDFLIESTYLITYNALYIPFTVFFFNFRAQNASLQLCNEGVGHSNKGSRNTPKSYHLRY